MLQMKDGANFTGFLTREDDQEIVLTDAAGQVRTVPKSSVAKKEVIPISLMPAGLTNSLRRDELIDLVRFLSELGKEGDFKVQEDGTLRAWLAHQNDKLQQPMPVASLVDGSLAASEWPVIKVNRIASRVADSRFEVLQDGEVVIETNATADATWQIDGKDVTVHQGVIKTFLRKGEHTLRLSLPSERNTHPRVRLASANAKPIHP